MPSRIRRMRLARAAMSGSCVTMMIVLPARVERFEHLHDFFAGGRVQVAGRLVGQDHVRVVDQRPGDGHALLLAAGKLEGPMVEAVAAGRPCSAISMHRSRASREMSPW